MHNEQKVVSSSRPPLRLWPGVLFASLLVLLRYVLPAISPDAMIVGLLGGLVSGLLIVLWWLCFSRAAWVERLGAVVVMALGLVGGFQLIHPSIATGAMGMLYGFMVIPVLCIAFVVWAALSRRLPDRARRLTMVATILLACGSMALLRTGGFTGDFDNDLHLRWTKTPEEKLLAQAAASAARSATGSLPAVNAEADTVWPGFRGAERDGVVRGVRIATDWTASPPVELWRRAVGPGWSSFAVRGEVFYTQEQRGDDEVVSCYRLATGEPVWSHRDAARFWESNGGAGPRGTPTLSGPHVYTLGGTGILNALDSATGAVVWSRNAASDAEMETPTWGFSSSPLVLGDLVFVAVSGRLVAYDLATGARRWSGPKDGVSYSSPHRVRIDGVEQILMLGKEGATSFAPVDGAVLWQHAWKGYPIVQPAQTADGDVLIAVADKSGVRRLRVARGSAGWTVEERWTSIGLKPYFDDFVVHEGHAYGFDGAILAGIDLADGQRKWKGGRYGNGQLVLLPDQDVLLVISERGEVALVRATPDAYSELARFKAIEGKTWNHPVLAGDVLLVRNDQEMAAFRLAAAQENASR